MSESQLRWELADQPRPQAALFDESIFEREPGRGEFRGMEFLHVRAKRIINDVGVDTPFGFRYTINPYRGCSHACAYCFARPTHAYLDLNIADDFDRKIVVKVNAVERLRAELHPRKWSGDLVSLGTNTDPYQRCEGKYRLTQGILDAFIERRNPFSILTKGTLILRDLDRLVDASRCTGVSVNLSIGTLDEHVWRTMEPGTPHPMQRIHAVAALNEAGVRCGVLMGPVLPGLSDHPDQLAEVVRAAKEAGARSISSLLLHLGPGTKEVFYERLGEAHPELLPTYRRLYGTRKFAPRADRDRVTTIVQRAAGRQVTIRARPRRDQGPTQLNLL
ncbi:MAG TPA: radical SAM protein [Acidimicrobiales bacterium]|jgi:DNA repair photolyase|nr:radical SAM protein [Acidimicrobiales bacterium]